MTCATATSAVKAVFGLFGGAPRYHLEVEPAVRRQQRGQPRAQQRLVAVRPRRGLRGLASARVFNAGATIRVRSEARNRGTKLDSEVGSPPASQKARSLFGTMR